MRLETLAECRRTHAVAIFRAKLDAFIRSRFPIVEVTMVLDARQG